MNPSENQPRDQAQHHVEEVNMRDEESDGRPYVIDEHIYNSQRRMANIDPRRFLTVRMSLDISTYCYRRVYGDTNNEGSIDYSPYIYNDFLTNNQITRRKEIFEAIDRDPTILLRARRPRSGHYINETSEDVEELPKRLQKYMRIDDEDDNESDIADFTSDEIMEDEHHLETMEDIEMLHEEVIDLTSDEIVEDEHHPETMEDIEMLHEEVIDLTSDEIVEDEHHPETMEDIEMLYEENDNLYETFDLSSDVVAEDKHHPRAVEDVSMRLDANSSYNEVLSECGTSQENQDSENIDMCSALQEYNYFHMFSRNSIDSGISIGCLPDDNGAYINMGRLCSEDL